MRLNTHLPFQRDFAGFTSQQSSNLAWGGVKYLESGDYVLVRKLCLSRNELIRSYPSRVKEIRFFATIDKGFRYPPWVPWLGAWVYWLFGNGFTRMPRFLTKARIQRDEPVVGTDKVNGGFEYSDAYLYDNDSLEKPLTREDIIAERCGVRPLVVRSQGNDKDQQDLTQISRKHAIDADRNNAHLSIYGGKLTDCINVGNEVSAIREDPRQAQVLIKGTDYLRCEIELAKRQEMIVRLEDFLRRRSKIALLVPRWTVRNAEGLMDACRILFEDQAQARYEEYFGQPGEVMPAQSLDVGKPLSP